MSDRPSLIIQQFDGYPVGTVKISTLNRRRHFKDEFSMLVRLFLPPNKKSWNIDVDLMSKFRRFFDERRKILTLFNAFSTSIKSWIDVENARWVMNKIILHHKIIPVTSSRSSDFSLICRLINASHVVIGLSMDKVMNLFWQNFHKNNIKGHNILLGKLLTHNDMGTYQSDSIKSEKWGHPPDDLFSDFGHPVEI